MRAGILLSVVLHVVFVALALFGVPRLLDESATRPIEVDIVRAEDVPQPKEEPKPEIKPNPQAAWDLPVDKPEPWPEAQPQQAEKQPDRQPEARPAPQQQQQARLSPDERPAQAPGPAPKSATKSEPSIFDPANIPMLMNLPTAPDTGFDAESTTAANLSGDERAAFRAHLRKCWKLPAGLSTAQTTRVVLRVNLRRDGKLASEPVLIEASASRDGPAIMQAAMRALKDCQPFGFLPPEKYTEWRMLDLSFSPRDMGGG